MLKTHPKKPIADVTFQIKGPLIKQISDLFADDWHFATGKKFTPVTVSVRAKGTTAARVITSGPDHTENKMELMLISLIASAKKRLVIVTPYFLPDRNILDILGLAAMSGVIYWNLVDGYTYVTGDDPHDMNSGENYFRGGLLRSDLTPKPAYNAIVDLFSKTWRTETQIETGADGMADFKGFYGDYSLEFMLPDGTAETRDVFFGKNCCRWFDFVF